MESYIRNLCLIKKSHIFSSMFISRSVMLLDFILRSMTHFELISVYGTRYESDVHIFA